VMMAPVPDEKKWNPLRPILTLIAVILAVGLVIQVSMSFLAYQRLGGKSGQDLNQAMADKAYLQDFYQTYGIRAATREEAELLLADMQRKEAAERQHRTREQERQDQQRKLSQFEEESRRMGAQVSDELRRGEQHAEQLRQEELRQQEERERQRREAEEARIERERARWRMQSSTGSDE
jgi:membrane protein involved in colicin uptake